MEAHAVFEGGGVRGIHRASAGVTTRLVEHSLTLVDAFGIPDRVLAAPIALDTEGVTP